MTLRIACWSAIGLGIVSAITMALAFLALTDIYHGEADVTAEWQAGKDPRKPSEGWSGGSVRLGGSDPSVLGDVILPLLTGTAAQVLGAAGFAGLQRRRWWRRRSRAPRPAQLVLDVDRIDEIRDACIAHGMTLGLNEAEATMLADAVQGVLRRAADGGPR